MRCPKCGAFMDNEKSICPMCGVNVRTYIPETNNMNNNMSNNSVFGSGNDFRSPNTSSFNQGANRVNDYRNVSYAPVKNEDKDIFDKYQENKHLINTILIIGVIALVSFIGFKYYEHKSKPPVVEPIIQNLYFRVDEGFESVNGGGQGKVTYIKSGDKGNACSISVSYGASTTGDHVKELFDAKKEALEPELDSSGNVVNKLDVYTAQDSSMSLKNVTWYYLNIFYRPSLNSEPTLLRYKYLTSLYKGYYYDIELINNSNDVSCSASLDNFVGSLEFIDK